MTQLSTPSLAESTSQEKFAERHIGPDASEVQEMLAVLGVSSLEELSDLALPASIRTKRPFGLDEPLSEIDCLEELRGFANQNSVFRSFVGMGYYGCLVPAVIKRNVLENPGWYTQYTPYQSEIAQGRLEALLNFQTMTLDLTEMEVANASLLDEATAAAEAMAVCLRLQKAGFSKQPFQISENCHPQTVAVVATRAESLGINLQIIQSQDFDFSVSPFGLLLQYPASDGEILDLEPLCKEAKEAGCAVVIASDLLALTLLRPPGSFGVDLVVGSSQRFGVPMGFGGPHAAFISTRQSYQRLLPGRIVGVSRDLEGRPALRLALQTREQHIRRSRATSNICTAQVLPAVMASMYAVYHGPSGLKAIAKKVASRTAQLAESLVAAGCELKHKHFFDTIRVGLPESMDQDSVRERAKDKQINLRFFENGEIGIALDETVRESDLETLCNVIAGTAAPVRSQSQSYGIPESSLRQTGFLTQPVFNRFHSETQMLRYIHRLQSRDLSLTTSMIPLGSCTMKLNATTEMLPISWPEFADLHPFAPDYQTEGYQTLVDRLCRDLAEITGFPAVSLQPNAGSQGEYAGLLIIRAYHRSKGEPERNLCLIPASAHGTNPASAVLAGLEVAVVDCDQEGNVDIKDLERKCQEHKDRLAALMITYPSTHGVFEEAVFEICELVHRAGGQVYLDGANMNAMLGLCRPSEFGADVCHLNLHKTFCIPHGGGGPGMGPVCVQEHLADFLPSHPLNPVGGTRGIGAVSAAPWGSASILPISYAYIRMMGTVGLKQATQIAILNVNYLVKRLEGHYPVLYRGRGGWVAHECILDARSFWKSAGVQVDDIAKRLMDYGFHAPTMSWPVAGTLMIEPTESESIEELDRFCEALIQIREEIREIETGEANRDMNLLKGAPHTARVVCQDVWDRPYSRERAAFPTEWCRDNKFWPGVSRIDNAFGDRSLVCSWSPTQYE